MIANHISVIPLPSRSASTTKRTRPRIVLPSFVTMRTVAWVAAGLLLMAFLYLAQESNAALIARDLRTKRMQLTELQRENSELRYEIASMAAPSSILERAKRLGLAPAQAKHVIYVDMPVLTVEKSVVMPSFAPYESQSSPAEADASPSAWSQILSLFGLSDDSGRAQAQSR